jgi:glutamate 5-kinase
MRIGIKVGLSLLLEKYSVSRSVLNLHLILRLCQQIAALINQHHEVFLVTSGAVASDSMARRRSNNLRAAVGQCRLISRYSEYLSIFGHDAAQFLLIDDDLKRNRVHLLRLFAEAFVDKVVPIVNANDVINSYELNQLSSCADNDNLFGELCLLLGAELAIIAIDGCKGIEDDDGKVYQVIDERNWPEVLGNLFGKSEFGYGLFGA